MKNFGIVVAFATYVSTLDCLFLCDGRKLNKRGQGRGSKRKATAGYGAMMPTRRLLYTLLSLGLSAIGRYYLNAAIFDNGGRRAGIERREFCYANHIPERRSGRDRRSGHDRRKRPLASQENERRSVLMEAA